LVDESRNSVSGKTQKGIPWPTRWRGVERENKQGKRAKTSPGGKKAGKQKVRGQERSRKRAVLCPEGNGKGRGHAQQSISGVKKKKAGENGAIGGVHDIAGGKPGAGLPTDTHKKVNRLRGTP